MRTEKTNCKMNDGRRIVILMLFILVTLNGMLFSPTEAEAGNVSFKLEDDQAYDNYRARIFNNGAEGKLEILRNGKRIYTQKGFRFRIGLRYSDAEFQEMGRKSITNDRISVGKDITGKGVPNLVVSEWTGGAHCCFLFHVFEIGQQFKKIGTLDAEDGDLSHFEDLRKDNKLQFIANDWNFSYWHTSFAASPAPDIILSYRNGAYTLDFDLMRKPPPTQSEIEDKINEVKKDEAWQEKEPPPILWSYMLDLIYSGNTDIAWTFFDKAWLSGIPGKEKFRRDFQARLRKSPYWKQIEKMNKITKRDEGNRE